MTSTPVTPWKQHHTTFVYNASWHTCVSVVAVWKCVSETYLVGVHAIFMCYVTSAWYLFYGTQSRRNAEAEMVTAHAVAPLPRGPALGVILGRIMKQKTLQA